MALPTQKRTKSSRKQRALHIGIKKTGLSVCPKCKKPVRPHHACGFCGTYARKKVLDTKVKKGGPKALKPKKEASEK